MFGSLGSFSAELRRRHVFRVALAYCAVGWAVAEASATLGPALGIPDWSTSLVAMLLVLGFPVSLVLAWAFDLTPAGVIRTAPLPGGRPAGAVAAPAVLALPFIDRSVGSDHQYLGDGITEELINRLGRVPGLRVVSRTSAFALRGAAADLAQIGTHLAVSHVVEGSVGVADGRLRLTVQLIGMDDGYVVWSRTFNRALDDTFLMQEEVALALVTALQPALLGGLPAKAATPQQAAVQQPAPEHAIDFDTYALFLRGRQQWNARTPAALQRALDYFTQSAERDPLFARAHAGIADCWAIRVDHGMAAPAEGLPPARAAAALALRLAPDLPDAVASAALVAQLEWRWAEAEAGFRGALQLCPGYVPARHRLALLLAWRGRFDEAREEMQRALRSDPLSTVIAASAGWIEYYAGNHDEVVAIERGVLQEQPGATLALVPLALALAARGEAAEAVAMLRPVAGRMMLTPAPHDHTSGEVAPAAPGGTPLLGVFAYVLGRAGLRDEATALTHDLVRGAAGGYVSPYAIARAWLGVDQHERALHALQHALAVRSPQLACLATDPAFEPIREHDVLCLISAKVCVAA
jgi:TolB-like protein/tetratricopeptide (TPR) repeat protein